VTTARVRQLTRVHGPVPGQPRLVNPAPAPLLPRLLEPSDLDILVAAVVAVAAIAVA